MRWIEDNIVFVSACLAAIGGALFGYDVGVINGALLQLDSTFNLETVEKEFIVSIMLAGAVVGSLLSLTCIDLMGRRVSIMLTSLIFITGAVLTVVAYTKNMLFWGRLITGVAVGLSAVCQGIYISELSPPEERGPLVSLTELACAVGILMSYMVSLLFLRFEEGWRYMFLVPVVPSVVLLVAMVFVPESPRWLCLRNRHEMAFLVLQRLRQNEVIARMEFKAILNTLPKKKQPSERLVLNTTEIMLAVCGKYSEQQLDGENGMQQKNVDQNPVGESKYENGNHGVGEEKECKEVKDEEEGVVDVEVIDEDGEKSDSMEEGAVEEVGERGNGDQREEEGEKVSGNKVEQAESTRPLERGTLKDGEVISKGNNSNDIHSGPGVGEDMKEAQEEKTEGKSKLDVKCDDKNGMLKYAIKNSNKRSGENGISSPVPLLSDLEEYQRPETMRSLTSELSSDETFLITFKGLLIMSGLTVFQQITGQPTFLYYTATLFESEGMGERGAMLASIASGTARLIGTIVAIWLMKTQSRHILLISGALLMSAALVIIALTINGVDDSFGCKVAVVLSSMMYAAGYSIGYGPNGYLLQAELFPIETRGWATSCLNALNWMTNLLVSFCYLSLFQEIGNMMGFFLYAALAIISVVYIYLCVPETQDLSLEEISVLMLIPFKNHLLEQFRNLGNFLLCKCRSDAEEESVDRSKYTVQVDEDIFLRKTSMKPSPKTRVKKQD
eukprot:Nk52_evm28s2325 gene=Nk52_evmTU28s2325